MKDKDSSLKKFLRGYVGSTYITRKSGGTYINPTTHVSFRGTTQVLTREFIGSLVICIDKLI